MKRMRLQKPFTVTAATLALVVALDTTPSDTAPSDPTRFASGFGQPQQMQELASLVLEAPTRPFHTSGMHAVTSGDLAAALDADPKPQEFELFDSERDEEARREILRDLPYGSAILRAAERHEVDGLLLAAIVEAESRFAPGAVSPRGAQGLMQIMPSTGAIYGAKDLLDPYVNLDVGSRYLRSLMKDYEGDLDLVLAAYNAGPGVVQRYGGIPPYRETRAYVAKVRARYTAHREAVRSSLLPEEPAAAPTHAVATAAVTMPRAIRAR
ncbi:MAG TPA: lytic transglycosylase domain-containing protein [Thermoanaerobaculia bacterium]|nr:lytic transglycosylase domain-containing protein [Thermoanaerobaculia bacterium]